ncbi:MAG TPA: NUDIX domain-containing protein [Myxococcota bacterium]|jgi:8-oxo-dGTP pyrophosphatase MutT (NUDIX family)
MARVLRIAAALVTRVRADGVVEVLLVRKRGTRVYMQPGGKLEPGESAVVALCRELCEELGLVVDASAPIARGRVSAPAANEAGFTVDADLFELSLANDDAVVAAAEIEEARWVSLDDVDALEIAPLLRDHALPRLLRAR